MALAHDSPAYQIAENGFMQVWKEFQASRADGVIQRHEWLRIIGHLCFSSSNVMSAFDQTSSTFKEDFTDVLLTAYDNVIAPKVNLPGPDKIGDRIIKNWIKEAVEAVCSL